MSVYTCELKRDPNGRIVEKVETVKGKSMKWTYSYDEKGRLFEAHLDNRLICQCYYDREGRRMQDYFPKTHGSQIRKYDYRMDNRLQQAGNNRYTHDKQGFRSIWNSGGKYTLYEYAPDYRLLKAVRENEGTTFEFTHNIAGLREAKYRNDKLVEAYIWHDFLRLALFHDGEKAYRFIYEEGDRVPYAMQREDGVILFFYYDQIGSLRVVADQYGNVIKEVLYDPFGGIIYDTNDGLRIPIGFSGGLHDRDLGFVRFGWRDYDTFTSRWTAPDPMGDAGGAPDWYGYCLNDPVNYVDPIGLMADDGDSLDGLSRGSIPSLDSKVDRGEIGAGGVGGGTGEGAGGSGGRGGRSDSEKLKTRQARVKTPTQISQEMEVIAEKQKGYKSPEEVQEERRRAALRQSGINIFNSGLWGAVKGAAKWGTGGGLVAGPPGALAGGVLGFSMGLLGGTIDEGIEASDLPEEAKRSLGFVNDLLF